MAIWDPRKECPGVPWIGLLLSTTLVFHRKSKFAGIDLERAFGIPGFSEEDEVDMLGSDDISSFKSAPGLCSLFGQKAFLRRGWYVWKPPATEFYTPPPLFRRPLTPGGVFKGGVVVGV